MIRPIFCAASSCVVPHETSQPEPQPCPTCGKHTTWRTMSWLPLDEPAKPYELTDGDRRFLRRTRIAADD